MDKNKAIKLFESLQSLGFKYFSSFGKLSIAAVFKNEIGNSYFLKIIYNKRHPIYVIDVKKKAKYFKDYIFNLFVEVMFEIFVIV